MFNTDGFKFILILVALWVFLSVLTSRPFIPSEEGPWYLGCADRHGKELLLKTDKKPTVSGSVVFIGDDVFVTPEPGMTCRIVRVKTIEDAAVEKKGVDI